MRNFLNRFFQGRYGAYGIDRLTKCLTAVALVLLILSFFTPLEFFYYIAFIIVFYGYFRLVSKNVPVRYKENEVFVRYTDKIVGIFRKPKSNILNYRTFHIYKCPGCGQKIRIPRGKGKIAIRCPKCGIEFIKRA